MRLEDYLVPYIISNVLGLLLIVLSLKTPKISRWFFIVIFLASGIFNLATAANQPDVYLEYGKSAMVPFYKNFIYGTFAENTQLFVSLIAVGQLAIGILLLTKKQLFRFGALGAILFLLAITPLGIGSAFPATFFMAIAMFVLFQKGTDVCSIDMVTSLGRRKQG